MRIVGFRHLMPVGFPVEPRPRFSLDDVAEAVEAMRAKCEAIARCYMLRATDGPPWTEVWLDPAERVADAIAALAQNGDGHDA
jgi:hypothetical protein